MWQQYNNRWYFQYKVFFIFLAAAFFNVNIFCHFICILTESWCLLSNLVKLFYNGANKLKYRRALLRYFPGNMCKVSHTITSFQDTEL